MMRKTTILGIGLLCLMLGFMPAQGKWIAADAAAPQAPEVNLISSTQAATVIDLTVHGFNSEEILQDGTIYHALDFGNQAALRAVGKPQLPVMTSLIGIPDHAGYRVSVEVIESRRFDGFRVYPAQEMTLDGEESAAFVIDRTFYQTDGFYGNRR